MNEATEVKEVKEVKEVNIPKPEPIPVPTPPNHDIAVRQVLEMIRSQGLVFGFMELTLSENCATLELNFSREGRDCKCSQSQTN